MEKQKKSKKYKTEIEPEIKSKITTIQLKRKMKEVFDVYRDQLSIEAEERVTVNNALKRLMKTAGVYDDCKKIVINRKSE